MSTNVLLFFSVSGGEIFVILLFVLIFFGSDKIPGIARTMGRTIRQVKDATSEIQRDIQKSVKDTQSSIEDGLKENPSDKKN
jgi:sec-independent protein translocase protein TatA